MSGSLLERVQMLTDQVDGLRREKGELEEQNRDLGFFISGGEKLKAVVQNEGGGGLAGLGEEEVRDGLLSLPEAGAGASGGGGGGGGPGGKRKGKGRR